MFDLETKEAGGGGVLETKEAGGGGVAELKTLIEDGNKTIAALREKTDELSKKYDGVTNDAQKKIEAAVADILKKQTDWQAEFKARTDEIEAAMNRPGKGGAKGATDDYSKAVRNYLRKGDEVPELKAMATSSNVDGGFLIAPTMRDGIMARLRRASPVRSVATVVQAPTEYKVPIERGDAGYEWAGETESRNETDTPTIGMISIPTQELSAKPKVSQRMLDTAEFDIEGFLSSRVASRFARAEGKAFVSGNGVTQPKGFLTYASSDQADEARAAQVIQYRASGAAGAFASSGPADVLVRTLYDLQGGYQGNARWMMKNTTAASVATLKDGEGRYLLQTLMDGQGGLVTSVLGRPLVLADDMPAMAANSLSIAIGDFEMGYTITESGSIVVLRDPYTQKPFVQFYTTRRVGGGVSDFDAIKFIKFAAS